MIFRISIIRIIYIYIYDKYIRIYVISILSIYSPSADAADWLLLESCLDGGELCFNVFS
jgi:hypothetical protein